MNIKINYSLENEIKRTINKLPITQTTEQFVKDAITYYKNELKRKNEAPSGYGDGFSG